MNILLLLAVLIAATIQTTAQNPTLHERLGAIRKELLLKLNASHAAYATARTVEERKRIGQQSEELRKLADIVNQIADEAKTAAGQIEMARMESQRLRAERHILARPGGMLASARATASPEPATPGVQPTPLQPTPMQAQHWSDGIPAYMYVAIGFLGLTLTVIWLLFPLHIYRYLRQLLVAQEQTNKLLIIQLEQTRQSQPPSTASVGAGTDQQSPDHPSKDEPIFTTEL